MADTGITRRKRTDGSVAYRVTWREGGTRDGARRSRTLGKLGDAKAFYSAVVANGYHLPEGDALPVAARVARPKAGGPTFADFAREHIAERTGISKRQRSDLRRDLDRHMAPYFAELAVDGKTARKWLRGLEDGSHPWLDGRPLAPRTRRRLVTQAGAIVNAAIKAKLAEDNPFAGIRIGREDHDRHEEQVTLTEEEWKLLRAELPNDSRGALADFLIGSGARWSEATALAVRHVDPAKLTVRIARAWQDNGEGGADLGPTKSRSSRRTVDIHPKTYAAIEPYLARPRDALVFAARNGQRLRAPNYWRDVWTPAVARARAKGLDKSPRIHDLRHTHVSWLIARNVSLAVVQKRLGHEDITTTIENYFHMLPSGAQAAVDALGEALGD